MKARSLREAKQDRNAARNNIARIANASASVSDGESAHCLIALDIELRAHIALLVSLDNELSLWGRP